MIFTALGNDCPWRTQESFPALTTNPKAKAAMPPAATTKDDHQEVTFLFSASTLQKQSQAVLFHFLTDPSSAVVELDPFLSPAKGSRMSSEPPYPRPNNLISEQLLTLT